MALRGDGVLGFSNLQLDDKTRIRISVAGVCMHAGNDAIPLNNGTDMRAEE